MSSGELRTPCVPAVAVAKLTEEERARLRSSGILGQVVSSKKRKSDEPEWTLDIDRALEHCSQPDDMPPPRRHNARALHALFTALSDAADQDGATNDAPVEGLDVDTLYGRLREHIETHPPRPSAQMRPLPSLRPTLRQYQRDAVEWMLCREGCGDREAQRPPDDSCLWRTTSIGDGVSLQWNHCNGSLREAESDPGKSMDEQRPVVPGGILADEMGLGKTVEVLALLLANPAPPVPPPPPPPPEQGQGQQLVAQRQQAVEPNDELPCVCEGTPMPFDGQWVGCDGCGRWVHAVCAGVTAAELAEDESYSCLLCATRRGEQSPSATGATLLICPQAILGQWRQEAARHVEGGGLRVCTYTGVRDALSHGAKQPARLAALHPQTLSAYDLVLTTFETLRSELDHTPHALGTPAGGADCSGSRGGEIAGAASGAVLSREFRRPSNRAHASSRMLSPLLSLQWWRVVIDEAQMVESGTAKAAAMALRLHARHRWAVSGTPMGRGRLADLQGLMAFLQLRPWSEASWWNHAVEMHLKPPAAAPAPATTADEEAAERSRRVAFRAAEARLLSLLHCVMWRNSKASVLTQLDLPPQTEQVHRLTFSSIEAHFYSKQARECNASAQRALSLRARQQEETEAAEVREAVMMAGKPNGKAVVKVDVGGGGDGGGGGSGGGGGGSAKPSGARVAQTAAAAERALTNLSTQGVLRLRQACCHPQLGSFGIRGSRRGGGGAGAGLADPMSMREILGKLIEEEKNRCEEEQRKVLFNLSALAGMRAMVGEHAAAAERYAEALEGSEANRQPMPLDTYVEPTFIGPTSLRFQAPSVAQRSGRTFGPIRWQLPSMGAPAAISADQTADAAAAGDAEAAWAAETSSGNVWVRIELSKPRRLSEVRMGITLTLTPTLTLTLVDSRR